MWRPERNTDNRSRPLPFSLQRVAHPAPTPLEPISSLTMATSSCLPCGRIRSSGIFHALALVGLGRAEPADLGGDLPDALLVGTADDDRRRGLADDLDVVGDRELDVVAVAELQVEHLAVAGRTIADAGDLEPACVAHGHARTRFCSSERDMPHIARARFSSSRGATADLAVLEGDVRPRAAGSPRARRACPWPTPSGRRRPG